ncbi:growth hormone releasing hormone receptor 2 [Salmo salar]|uniref:Growth hormone releasing hormone receptor 2 n=1 Tax=Salmo salar TaxID=8030 RepID=A0A1S3NHF3_SALSA|nr:growth hormone releasing hormone receptor 2 [Salmo salar]
MYFCLSVCVRPSVLLSVCLLVSVRPVCTSARLPATQIRNTHPECSIVLHLLEKEGECKLQMRNTKALSLSTPNNTTGCLVEWDGVSCWPAALNGESLSVSCPLLLLKPDSPPALITRNCTPQGWSKPSLPYYKACYFEDSSEEEEETGDKQNYFATVKIIYTVGYGVSLASLFIAILVFCIFRKLLCIRTSIHLNLFSTFILRGLAVFVKDAVLFADESMDHCTVSTVTCKAAVTFFQYCVLANFFWLLVEGLYLQTLLVFTFAQKRKLFWLYAGIGWGTPSVTIIIWTLLKSQFDNEGCWDNLDSALWWIIKTPILLSVFINFVVFVNISRIIIQKTKATDQNGSEGLQVYRRLARSTLLLIPLFGVHYVVFALLPEHVGVGARLSLELVLGSFQGFIVALLYCFLNGEVQNEIRKAMKGCRSQTENNVFNLATQDYVA